MESPNRGIRKEPTAEQQILHLREEVAALKASLVSARDPRSPIARNTSLRANSKTIAASSQHVDFSRHELNDFFM